MGERTGRPAKELVETREIPNSRYDHIKSGKVKLIPGNEVIARLRERSAAFRLRNAQTKTNADRNQKVSSF